MPYRIMVPLNNKGMMTENTEGKKRNVDFNVRCKHHCNLFPFY